MMIPVTLVLERARLPYSDIRARALAKSKELSQKKIPDLAKCSYRTVLRELKILEDMGWIKFVREKKNNGKRGAPLNMWKISFKGLIIIMGFMDVFSDDFEKIIESHKDEWIIFEEWNFISKNDDVRLWVLNEIKLFCDLHHVNFLIYYHIYKQRLVNEYNSEKLRARGCGALTIQSKTNKT